MFIIRTYNTREMVEICEQLATDAYSFEAVQLSTGQWRIVISAS